MENAQNVSRIQPKANEYLEFTIIFKNQSYLTLNNMLKFLSFCFEKFDTRYR